MLRLVRIALDTRACSSIGTILGHADVKTTSRYAHLADDPVKQAADAISRSVQVAFSGQPAGKVVSFPGDAKWRG